jgi:hypothetical protein
MSRTNRMSVTFSTRQTQLFVGPFQRAFENVAGEKQQAVMRHALQANKYQNCLKEQISHE